MHETVDTSRESLERDKRTKINDFAHSAFVNLVHHRRGVWRRPGIVTEINLIRRTFRRGNRGRTTDIIADIVVVGGGVVVVVVVGIAFEF
jgi:hypothetical protein